MKVPELPHIPLWCGVAYRLRFLENDDEEDLPVRLKHTPTTSCPRTHIFETLENDDEVHVRERTSGDFFINDRVPVRVCFA